MAEQLWSVEFVVPHHERVPLDYAGPRVVGPDAYMVVLPWEDGPSTLHIDARASTSQQARERATETYRRMRELAELAPDADPQVITIAEVVGVPHTADRFIFAADDMLAQRQFGLAVVAAQIHCELSIRRAVEEAAGCRGSPLAELAIAVPASWSLTDRHGPRCFEALLGVAPSSAPCWERYRTHVARRHSVVHAGAEITPELAAESIDAAVEMVKFVEDALARARSNLADETSGGS